MYINIGTQKACLFVSMSIRLLKKLREYPFLYYAVEEALISAKNHYYAIGIIVWYELLKNVLSANSKRDSEKRNITVHDILKVKPTKLNYNILLDKFKEVSKRCYLKEAGKTKNKKEYDRKIQYEWKEFIKGLSKIV